MTLVVVGIDPGATGAISILVNGDLVAVEDMPTDQVQVGVHLRSRVSAHRLWAILSSAKGAHVFVERPEARPLRGRDKATGQTVLRQPGAAGMLAFGEGYGMLVMGCAAAGMVLTELRPGAWKRAAGVAASKDDADAGPPICFRGRHTCSRGSATTGARNPHCWRGTVPIH